MPIQGECFCGQVAYRVEGRLRDARSCHCSRCRKAFSSQASAYALVRADEFAWLRGEALLTTYLSGADFGHQFCSQCGSLLSGVYRGDVHGVALGCVDGDPDVEIGRHIFVGSKAAWEVLPEGITTYDGAPPDESTA